MCYSWVLGTTTQCIFNLLRGVPDMIAQNNFVPRVSHFTAPWSAHWERPQEQGCAQNKRSEYWLTLAFCWCKLSCHLRHLLLWWIQYTTSRLSRSKTTQQEGTSQRWKSKFSGLEWTISKLYFCREKFDLHCSATTWTSPLGLPRATGEVK